MNIEKLKIAEKNFLNRYPGGFDNPEMMVIAKKHKPEKMKSLARESFCRENFNNPQIIIDNMIKVVSRSSMVSVFEKPKFRDYAKMISYDEKVVLSKGLYEFLYENEELGFEMIQDILKMGKLAKWTIMTICPVYFHPLKDVFVKPTTVKGVLRHFEIDDLVYKPTPSFDFYKRYRDMINEMKKNVDKSLYPDNAAFSGFLMVSME